MARRSTARGAMARPVPAALRVAVLAVLALLLGACGSGPSAGTPPIPTFPGPGAAPATSAAPPRDSILPTDCNQVLSSDTLPNLLGLPLGSVKVTALRDVPAPSVGRLERVTCNYTSNGGPGAPSQGTLVLKLLASGYTTPTAAADQSEVNREAQARSGVPGRPTPLGAAAATYFDAPDGPALVVVYGRVTTSLTLTPGRPIAREQSLPVLTDLALRALPVLVPPGGGAGS